MKATFQAGTGLCEQSSLCVHDFVPFLLLFSFFIR